jgi:hypothetical protein
VKNGYYTFVRNTSESFEILRVLNIDYGVFEDFGNTFVEEAKKGGLTQTACYLFGCTRHNQAEYQD